MGMAKKKKKKKEKRKKKEKEKKGLIILRKKGFEAQSGLGILPGHLVQRQLISL